MQFKFALGALACRLGGQGEQRSALGAARDRMRRRHVHRARPKSVLADRLLHRSGFLPLAVIVLVSVLAVFSAHKIVLGGRLELNILSLAAPEHKSGSQTGVGRPLFFRPFDDFGSANPALR